MTRLKKTLRLGARLLLGGVAVVLVLLLGLLVSLRLDGGKRALLRIVLPIANRALHGHVQLSSLEGDLTHSIILHDLKIDDAEGVQALYARRIEAHYDLSALWHREVRIDDLDIDGAQVLVRHMKDNRVNFASLGGSAEPQPHLSLPSGNPPHVIIAHLRVRFDGGYDPPLGHEHHPLERPRGSFDIEGGLDILGGNVTVRLDHLISDSRDPVAAHVELSGGLKVDPPSAALPHTEITFANVALTVSAEGRELERVNPQLKAAGRWKVSVSGGGPLSGVGLHAHVVVTPPKGTLVADGTLARTWPGVKFAVQANARGLDPAADWRGLQSGHVDFQVAAHSDAAGGGIEVARFEAVTGPLRVNAHGRGDFAGNGNGELAIVDGDLRRLAALGLPGLAGSAQLTAQLDKDGVRLRGRADLRDQNATHVELDAALRRDRASGIDVSLNSLIASSKKSGHFQLPAPAHLHLYGSLAAPSLDGELAGVAFQLRGKSGDGDFTAEINADAPNLSRLGAQFGGRAHVTAHAVKGAQLSLDAVVRGSDLRMNGARVNTLDARLHFVDLAGSAHVTVDRLAAPGFLANSIVLDAKSDSDRFTLALKGNGPAALALALDGRYLRSRSASLTGAELTVRQLELVVAHQSWALENPSRIRVEPAELSVAPLVLGSLGQRLGIEGKYHASTGALDAKLTVRDLHPANFAKIMGIKDALSDTSVNGSIHVGGTVSAPLVQASIKATSDKKVEWYGLSFNTVSVEASAGRERVVLQVNAWGTGSGRLALDVHAVPLWSGDRLMAAEATIDRLRLSANNHVWQTASACSLLFDSAVTVGNCKLVAGKEQVLINGRVPFRAGPMDATLTTHALDLRALGAFLAPGHKEPPTTSFDARVHASGTRQAPIFDLELSGHGSQVDEGVPENVDYRVRAHYGAGRVDGEVSARQVGLKLGIGGRFDLPISFAQTDDQPIRLELEARPVPFFKIRDRLPTAIAGVSGFFSLHVRASGTTRHPIFSAELHAPSWTLDDLSNNDTVINLNYDGAVLRLNSVTSFAATSFAAALFRVHPKRNSGTIKVELKTPVDLGHLLSQPRDVLNALQHTAPLTGTAEVKSVELQRVPLQVIGIATPFTAGLIDGALSATGTLDAPSVHVSLRAAGLAKPGVVDQVDVEAKLAFEHDLLQVSGKLDLRKQLLLSFQGEGALDAKRLFDGESWSTGRVRGDFTVSPFDLSRLRGMQPRLARIAGKLSGKGALRGTFARPELLMDLGVANLELGGDRFTSLHVDGRYDDRRFKVKGFAEQTRGGKLSCDAVWSRGVDDPLAVSLEAQRLELGFLASASEEIRALSGELDAKMTIGGTRAEPQPEGFVTMQRGELALRSGQYRNGAFSARVNAGHAVLKLDVETGDGKLSATGDARLRGLQPNEVELSAHAQRFALVYGSFAANLDADFGLQGSRDSGQWTGRVDLRRGTINLPDLSGAEQVQPLGELADVRFGDQRAERIARPAAGKGHWLAARIAGPLAVRGHEVNLDLVSDLALTIAPGKTSASGSVQGKNGTVQLFGRPYQLETAEVRFNGVVDDPALHMRATRRVRNATLIVTVSGTARNPEVALTVDPPVLDQSQLLELMLTDSKRRPSEGWGGAISFRELNHQIGGLLSNVILRKIREQMATQLPSESFEPADNQTSGRYTLSPIEVGRYLSDRVYLSYEHQFGSSIGRSASNANESQIKVSLPHGGELDTSAGDGGVAGVYLYWTFRY